MNETEQLSRRRLLTFGAAGLGIAATDATGTFFATREDSKPVAKPEIQLPPFNINDFITDSDWNNITAASQENNRYSRPYWKAMISVINQEKGQEVSLDKSEWENAIYSLESTEKNRHMEVYTSSAATIKMAFPDKARELHSIIDHARGGMIDSIHHIPIIYGSAWSIPYRGFEFKNVLYPNDDITINDWTLNLFTSEADSYYNDPYAQHALAPALARLRHFSPEKLPPYLYDTNLRTEMRSSAVNNLEFYRSSSKRSSMPSDQWFGFVSRAYDSGLLEA